VMGVGKTLNVKCRRLTPGKDYTMVRDDGDHDDLLLIVDGPDAPADLTSQPFWSYTILEETE
jgi:hypothetical protein